MLKFFADKKEILAVMSERPDGSMKIIENGENIKNRNCFFEKNKIDENVIFSAEIVHGSKVEIVDKNSPKIIKGADALVTREKIFLAVTVADCIPIYFYDDKSNVVGIAHAGWRGITKEIIKNTLDKIIEIGGTINNIRVILGPGLRACHFEIKEDVLDNFNKWAEFIIRKDDKIFADLFGIIKKELLNNKVLEKNIFDFGECTFDNKEKYFSYRRDKPEMVEAMIAMIGIK